MNDPPRRRSPDGFDDDAIFADIVAHLNDDVAEPEPMSRPAAEDTGTNSETTDTKTETDTEGGGTSEESTLETTDTDSITEGSTAETSSETSSGSTSETTSETTDVASDGVREGRSGRGAVDQSSGVPTAPGDPQALPAPQVWRAHEVDDSDEEHFEPPPVTPLPAGDLQFWAIITGMGGGPLLLLYLVFFNRDASGYWILAAIAMSIGGFALLVSRMPRAHEDDDDGARL